MPDERLSSSFELEEYVAVLRRRWKLLLIGVAVPLAAAMLYTLLAPRVYEATAVVQAVNPATDEAVKEPASTATGRAVFASRAVAAQLLGEFGLDRGPSRLTPDAFLSDVLRVDEVRGTSLLRVNVRLSDPELAARLANRLTELVVKRSRTLEQTEDSADRRLLKVQLEEAEAQLQALEQKLLTARTSASLELLRQESDTLLEQRADAARLQTDIEAERARLSAAETELGKLTGGRAGAGAQRSPGPAAPLPAPMAVGRSDAQGAAAATASRPAGSGSGADPPAGGSLREVLEYQVATGRTRLAGLEAQRRQLLRRATPDGPLQRQLGRLYEHEIDIGRLELEYDVLKTVYSDVARRYQQARLDGVARATMLQLIEPAVPPPHAAFPRAGRILAVALLGGLMLGLLVMFTLEAVQPARRTVQAPGGPAPSGAALEAGTGRDERLLDASPRNGV